MPEMCGLGGDLFAVIHVPGSNGRESTTLSIQGSGNSPRSASLDLIRRHATESGQMPYQGPLSISVPGMVDAYFQMLDRFGTRTFAEVMEPAHSLAADGFVVHQLGAGSIASSADVLARDEAAAAVFLPGGRPVRAGERLVQADLGKTL
jgi:gamma-glutamyltranspeptidase/glutathione hydrolase